MFHKCTELSHIAYNEWLYDFVHFRMNYTMCYLFCFIFFREGSKTLINKYYNLLAYVIIIYYICSVISNEAKAQKTKKMKTHILFLKEGTYGYDSEYIVSPITEQWHVDCNNFKGTIEECEIEAKEQTQRDLSFFAPQQYVSPHYDNAEYGSIYDY